QRRMWRERGCDQHGQEGRTGSPAASPDGVSTGCRRTRRCWENACGARSARRIEAMTASTEWGRVDAEGTVWVRTGSGERAVGAWHAGSPEDGLAHYMLRYEDLATEVGLLETRLQSGAGDPKSTLTHTTALPESLPT